MQGRSLIPTVQVCQLAAHSMARWEQTIEGSKKQGSSWKATTCPGTDSQQDQSIADFARGIHAAAVEFAEGRAPRPFAESRLAGVVCIEKRIRWAVRSAG